jgi:ATP/ADP translocase
MAMAESGKPLFAAVAISCAAAFLLCGYEFIRSTSTTLFTEAYSAENLPKVMAVVPLGIIAVLYIYGRLLSWLGPRKTLLITTLASGLGIALCYLLISTGARAASGVLFVWREAYIVLLIEQYWSFLNSTFGTATAKKLNGPVCGVASLGAVLGGSLVGGLSRPWGTEAMLLWGAGLCLPAALASELAYRRCGEPADGAEAGQRTPSGVTANTRYDHLGLRLFRTNRVLVFILLAIVATQVLSTVLDLEFQKTLKAALPHKDERNAYSGNFYAQLNMAAAFGQFVMAPVLLRLLPLGAVHVALPFLNMAACAWLLASPSLASAGLAYLVFKSADYSLFRSAKEVLYIPFSFNVRYRAKEVIDVFGYRFGKGGTSLLIALRQGGKALFSASDHALIAICAAGVWLGMIVPAVRGYGRMRKKE